MFESYLYIHVLLKFAVPVIWVVVAGLVPLRGGNEFWTCCNYNFISVNFCFSFVWNSLAYIVIIKKNRKIKINRVKKLSATDKPIKQDSGTLKGCSQNFLTSTPVTFRGEYHPPPPPSTLFMPAMQITLCYTSRRFTVVCETKWSETQRNGTKRNKNLSFSKWKSAVCEMRICSLRNENL